MKRQRRAFTLIELLVVVLIIGILSAVALPQYTKTVEKSRMSEALQITASLRQAVDLYVLENGYQAVELVGDSENNGVSDKLSINIESQLDCTRGDVCSSKYFEYDAYCNTNDCEVIASRCDNGNCDNGTDYYEIEWIKSASSGAWSKSCNAYEEGFAETLCNSFNAG